MKRIVHLVQPGEKGKTKFITLTLEGAIVSRTWGFIGCKTLTTSDTKVAINRGKANEISPERAAQADFKRLMDDRMKEGYRITKSLSLGESVAGFDRLDFDNPTTSFAPSKPVTEISDEALDKLFERNRAHVQVKGNGLRHFLFQGTERWDVRIYTRRMEDHTVKYPSIVEYARKLYLPACSVLDMELMVDPERKYEDKHMSAFSTMQSISKLDTLNGKCNADQKQSLRIQESNPVRGMVFNILYWNSEATWKSPYRRSLDLLSGFLGLASSDLPLFQPIYMSTLKSAKSCTRWVQLNTGMYEGLVIWDLDGIAEVRFTGKPKRCACWKRKGVFEADVVATGFTYGTGKNQKRIGSLLIAQFVPETGEYRSVGKCAGLKDEDRDPKKWTFPQAIIIEGTERFPTGKFEFPQYMGPHPDKTPEECVYDGENEGDEE